MILDCYQYYLWSVGKLRVSDRSFNEYLNNQNEKEENYDDKIFRRTRA